MYSRKVDSTKAKKSRRGGRKSEERKTTESWIDDQTQSRERRRRIRSLRRRRWSASYFDRKSKEVAAHAASVAYSAMIDAVYAFQGCRQFVKRSQFSEKNEMERSAFRKVKTKSLTEMEATVAELALWIAETLYICAGATRDGKANEELLETACSINLDQRMGVRNRSVCRLYTTLKPRTHIHTAPEYVGSFSHSTLVETISQEGTWFAHENDVNVTMCTRYRYVCGSGED